MSYLATESKFVDKFLYESEPLKLHENLSGYFCAAAEQTDEPYQQDNHLGRGNKKNKSVSLIDCCTTRKNRTRKKEGKSFGKKCVFKLTVKSERGSVVTKVLGSVWSWGPPVAKFWWTSEFWQMCRAAGTQRYGKARHLALYK